MRCFGWLVALLEISSKTADDIVENNDQVILSGFESETIWVIGTHYNFSKKVVAEVFKIPVFSEIWTRIAEFKLQIVSHYNIEPIKKTRKMGFEPTRAETNGLSVHCRNHSAIFP